MSPSKMSVGHVALVHRYLKLVSSSDVTLYPGSLQSGQSFGGNIIVPTLRDVDRIVLLLLQRVQQFEQVHNDNHALDRR